MQEIIKIAHVSVETPLVLSSDYALLLIVENPKQFFVFADMLDRQLNGGEGEFVFSQDDQIVPADKFGCSVCDLLHFGTEDKRVVSLLFKRLEKESARGEFIAALGEVNAKIAALLENLFAELPFKLAFDEAEIGGVLKAASVRFEDVFDSLTEKIICFINIMVELKGCRFFVFVNLKSVLSDDDLHCLYRHCALEKVGLLLIESSKCRPLLEEERAVIITEDLCEIIENFSPL